MNEDISLQVHHGCFELPRATLIFSAAKDSPVIYEEIANLLNAQIGILTQINQRETYKILLLQIWVL